MGRDSKLAWSYAFAANAGRGKDLCQDAFAVKEHSGYLIAAIADGAGSAPRSHVGSLAAVRSFVDFGVEMLDGESYPRLRRALDDSQFFEAVGLQLECLSLIEGVRAAVEFSAKLDECPLSHLATTLLGVVIGNQGAVFFQVGDGAAVAREAAPVSRPDRSGRVAETFSLAIAPEGSEFLNTTHFLTDEDLPAHVQVRRLQGRVDQIALLTDGLQGFVVDDRMREPHNPFFERVFGSLSAAPGHDEPASRWLETQLAADPVQRRTDDDTSIVIARRVAC